MGLAEESLCRPSLSTNHLNFPGSALAGLCSAHWAGKRRAGLDSFNIYSCASANGMTHSGMGGGGGGSTELKSSRGPRDIELQPGWSALSE